MPTQSEVRRQVREAVAKAAAPRAARTLKHELADGSVAERFTSRDYTHVTTSTGHRSEPLAGHGKRRVTGWHTSHHAASHRGREMERGGWSGVLVEPIHVPPGEPPAPVDPEAPAGTTTPSGDASESPTFDPAEAGDGSTMTATIGESAVEAALQALDRRQPAQDFEPLRAVAEGLFEDALHPRGRGGKFAPKIGDHVHVGGGVLLHKVTAIEGDHVIVRTPSKPSLGGGAKKRVPISDLTKAPAPKGDPFAPVGLPKGAPRGTTVASFPTSVSSRSGPIAKLIDSHHHTGPGGDAAVPAELRQHLEAIPKGGVRTIGGVHVEREIKQGDYNVEGDRHLTGVHNAVVSMQSARKKNDPVRKAWKAGKRPDGKPLPAGVRHVDNLPVGTAAHPMVAGRGDKPGTSVYVKQADGSMQSAMGTAQAYDASGVLWKKASGAAAPKSKLAASKPSKAADLMNEKVNYGGIPTPRGEVYKDVLKKAEAAGHPNPKASADRYMQGLDQAARRAKRQVKESEEQMDISEAAAAAVADVLEAADSMAKASSPEPFSKSKTSNWIARAGGLPPYIQHIAHDLMEKRGKTESNAIQMAIGIVRNWASGEGKVDANTRAAASKAVAEFEAKRAKSKAVKEAAVEEVQIEEADYEVAEAVVLEADSGPKAKAFCVKDREKVTPTDDGKCPKCGLKLPKPKVEEAVLEALSR